MQMESEQYIRLWHNLIWTGFRNDGSGNTVNPAKIDGIYDVVEALTVRKIIQRLY